MFKQLFYIIKFFRRAFGRHQKTIVFLFFLGFLNSFLEGVGISAVIPFLSFIGQNRAGNTDIITRSIEGFFNYLHVPFTLKFLLIFIIFLFIIKAAVLFFANFIAALATSKYENKVRSDLFRLTIKSAWPYLIKQKVGYLDQSLTTDINRGSALFFGTVTTSLIFTKLIVYIFVAMSLSMTITFFALILGLLTLFIFKPLFRKNREISQRSVSMYKELAHFINENIIGMKTIKAMFKEEQIIKRGDVYFEKVKDFNVGVAFVRNITIALIQPISFIFIIAMFAFFYKTSLFNFASFAVIVYAINQIFSQIQAGQAHLHGIISTMPFLESVMSYREKARQNLEADFGTKEFSFKNKLEFRNVNFSYDSGEKILKQMNFFIKRGEMVGIIGPSGAGKTTVVDLLLRLFQPNSGSILLDKVNINDISLGTWRINIGYVAQDIFLFNDTIENNIKFYNNRLSRREVERFAKIANIFDFVSGLPDKFLTIIGERGILLSGGQRQRIVLARVLAKNPSLLILDEATSALDNESERQIQKAIEKLKGKITVIVIAHRLSTVKNCDRLLVFKKGRILEEGKPQELRVNKSSYYYEMYNLKNDNS